MRNNLEKIVKFLIYCTFFVPLAVFPSSFIFPFIVPKILIFRSLVEVLWGLYALLLIINWQEYRPRGTWLSFAVIAFLVSFGVSTFVGVDSYHSFWDNHERMLGLFTIVHYVGYYFICASVFKKWSEWQIALKVFLLAGTAVMVVGLLQVGDPYFLLNQGAERVASTLGNSIYVGGYGMFLAFAAALLFLKEKNSIWRWFEAIFGFFALLGMFYSGTRGSMLGTFAGIVAVIFIYSIVLKEYPRVRKGIWATAGALILLVGVLYAYRQTDFVQKIPAVGRTLSTSLSDVTGSARFIAWRIAWQSFKEKPVFGWGPNNFFYAFNAHYNPKSLEFGYGETWFDNAHNIIMNTLAVQGGFGLAAYLSIFALAIIMLVRAYGKKQIDYHILAIGSAFLVAHLVQNVTVFENPTSYLYFMFWLAMINRLSSAHLQAPNTAALADKKIGIGSLAGAGALVSIFIFIFNIQPARANFMALEVLRDLNANPDQAIEEAKTSLSFNSPHIDDIRSDVGRAIVNLIASDYKQLGKDKTHQLIELTYNELQKNIVLHPLDIRNHLSLASLLQTAAPIENNVGYLMETEKLMQDALNLSPRRQQLIYGLAGIKAQLGKNGEAVTLLEGAIQDNPVIGESYWRLAYVYKISGQPQKAQEILDSAVKNGAVFTDQDKSNIQQIMAIGASKK